MSPGPSRKPKKAQERDRRKPMSLEERARRIKARTIRRREGIPDFTRILSVEGGDIAIPAPARKDYAVLLTGESSRQVHIMCSESSALSGRVDNNFQTISLRCSSKGYKVARLFATPEIISIVYDSARSGARSDEDLAKNSSALQRTYDSLLFDALKEDVSDIHIEIHGDSATIRFRKHGALYVHQELSVTHARALATVIYQVVAKEKDVTFNERIPQDGVVDRDIGGHSLRVRLATMPAYPDGFDMVMRLLPRGKNEAVTSISKLGYSESQIQSIERSVAKPVGVTIMAGTTGSGKSTSLAGILTQKIQRFEGRIKVITVEDPPERMIPGATQTPVVRSRTQAGGAHPFAAAIKAAMRSDPDVLMVGEVRDPESAELLIHAVQSGHQAFTTVHAPSAIGIVSRLRSLGVPNDILGSQDFFSGLIYQSLVPRLCAKCSRSFEEYRSDTQDDPKEQGIIQRIIRVVSNVDRSQVRFKNTSGCGDCTGGIAGRMVVAEVVVPDSHMVRLFAEGKDTEAWLYFRGEGGKSVLDHGIDKMRSGLCCPYDIEAKLGLLDAQVETLGGRDSGSTAGERGSQAQEQNDSAADHDDSQGALEPGLDDPLPLDPDFDLKLEDDDWLSVETDQGSSEIEGRQKGQDGRVIHAPFGASRLKNKPDNEDSE